MVYGLLTVVAVGTALAAAPFVRLLSRSSHPVGIKRSRRRSPIFLSVTVAALGGVVLIDPGIVSVSPGPFLIYIGIVIVVVVLPTLLRGWIKTLILFVVLIVGFIPVSILFYWSPLPEEIRIDFSNRSMEVCGGSGLMERSLRFPTELNPAEDWNSVDFTETIQITDAVIESGECLSLENGEIFDPVHPKVDFYSIRLPEYLWWLGTNQLIRLSAIVVPDRGAPESIQLSWDRAVTWISKHVYGLAVQVLPVDFGEGAIGLAEEGGYPQPGTYRLLIDSVVFADTVGDDDHAVPSGE